MAAYSGVPHEEFFVLVTIRNVKLRRRRGFDLKNEPEYLGDDREGNAYYKTTREGASELAKLLFTKMHGMEASFKQYNIRDVPAGLRTRI